MDKIRLNRFFCPYPFSKNPSHFFLFTEPLHPSSFLLFWLRDCCYFLQTVIISCAALGQRGRDQAPSEPLIQINILSSLICRRSHAHVHRHGACRCTCVHCLLLVWKPFIRPSSSPFPFFLTQVSLPGKGATLV